MRLTINHHENCFHIDTNGQRFSSDHVDDQRYCPYQTPMFHIQIKLSRYHSFIMSTVEMLRSLRFGQSSDVVACDCSCWTTSRLNFLTTDWKITFLCRDCVYFFTPTKKCWVSTVFKLMLEAWNPALQYATLCSVFFKWGGGSFEVYIYGSTENGQAFRCFLVLHEDRNVSKNIISSFGRRQKTAGK